MTQKHWCMRAARERDMNGNGILLDRPLPFKLHQSYRPLPCFIPALQEIWSNPAKQCGDDGDDLNTAVGISLPRWSGNAVIVTALYKSEWQFSVAFRKLVNPIYRACIRYWKLQNSVFLFWNCLKMPRPLFQRNCCWDPLQEKRLNLFNQNTDLPNFLEPDEVSWIESAKKIFGTSTWPGSMRLPLFSSLSTDVPPKSYTGSEGQDSESVRWTNKRTAKLENLSRCQSIFSRGDKPQNQGGIFGDKQVWWPWCFWLYSTCKMYKAPCIYAKNITPMQWRWMLHITFLKYLNGMLFYITLPS